MFKLHLWPVLSKLMNSIDQKKCSKVMIQNDLFLLKIRHNIINIYFYYNFI